MSFDVLGLRPGADERDVRRAYARLLKLNRPDDDAAAFQALNEAYQDCLAQLREQRWDEQGDNQAPPGAAPGEPPVLSFHPDFGRHAEIVTAAEEAPFLLDPFIAELLERVAKDAPDEVAAWLSSLPALYSIRLKSSIAVEVVGTVVEHEPPLPLPACRKVADFFGIEQMGPQGWWLLERLEEQARLLDVEHRFRIGNLPRANPREEVRAINAALDRELARPDWSWRTPLLALWPGVPSLARDRMLELDNLTEGLASRMILPRRRQFFLGLADRTRLSLSRYVLSILRTLLFGGALVLLARMLTGAVSERLVTALSIAGLAFLAWQTVLAGLLKLRGLVQDRGYGHLVREGLVVIGIVVALVLGLEKSESLRMLPFGFAVMACLQAYTGARFNYCLGITAVFIAADAAMSLPRLALWPLPPILLGLCCSAALVAIFDRVRARRRGIPVEALAQSDEGMESLAGFTFLAMLVGTVILSVALARWI